MNREDVPATENQLSLLRRFGYAPDHPLRNGEAARLILDFERHQEDRRTPSGKGDTRKITTDEASSLRAAVEHAQRTLAAAGKDGADESQRAFALAVAKRQEWWIDTCRDPGKMQARSAQRIDLYMKHGCLFDTPTREQVREVLEALDSAMPSWEKEHPELFYQTVEMNFRELLRHP
jgi:hypothetical protein